MKYKPGDYVVSFYGLGQLQKLLLKPQLGENGYWSIILFEHPKYLKQSPINLIKLWENEFTLLNPKILPRIKVEILLFNQEE